VEQEYLKIAPNPVGNAVYQLITNVESIKLQNARVTVFNVLGILMTDIVINKKCSLLAPSVEGIYIVKMTLTGGKYTKKPFSKKLKKTKLLEYETSFDKNEDGLF
jgi:hypothetical protein